MMKKILAVLILLVSLNVYGINVYAGQNERQSFGFVVMGDNRPASMFRPEQPYIYHKVVNKAVTLDPVLILNTGDLILGFDADSRVKANEEFDDFEKATGPIRERKIPLYITMGNHSGYTEFAREAFEGRYKNRETGKLYYSVDFENAHFINLCTELKNEKTQITGVQLEWLKDDLKKAAGKHIFVLLHRPLYPKIKHFKDSLNKYPEKRDALAKLFKDYDVDMVFAGHVHVYNFSVIDGLSQIIAGGSGAPLAGNIEQGGFNHFFHVIVTGDDVDYRLIPLPNEVIQATRFMKEGRVDGALSLARKAQEAVPDHPMPLIIAASGYKLQGKIAKYNESIAKLLPILGSEKEVYFRLGEFCLSVDLLDLSHVYLSKARVLDDNSFKVFYHLAKLNEKQKLYPQALEMFQKALSLTRDQYYSKKIRKNILKIKKLGHQKV